MWALWAAPSDQESMETNTTTAGTWLSIKDAAGILDCDERTVRRRRDRGEIEGRKRTDGNRQLAEVWIEAKPAAASKSADLMAAAITTASERVERPAAAAIQAYQERATIAEAMVQEMRADIRRARTGARVGWSLAAAVAALAAAGGVWGVRALTTEVMRSEALTSQLAGSEAAMGTLEERLAQSDQRAAGAVEDARAMTGQVSTLSARIADLSVQLDQARTAAAQAERARVEAEIAEYAPGVLRP